MKSFELTNNVPRMRTIKQTALETGLHEYFIRQLVKQNKIKYVMSGRKVLINLDLFIAYLNGETPYQKAGR